jgi:hypothetical protein
VGALSFLARPARHDDSVAHEVGAVRVRSSLRYATAPGAFPTVVGWPFAWIEVGPELLTFSSGRLVPFGRVRWSVRRDDITKVERTQNGLRFYAEGFPDPWVVASMLRGHFLRRLADLGIEAQGAVRPSTWKTI